MRTLGQVWATIDLCDVQLQIDSFSFKLKYLRCWYLIHMLVFKYLYTLTFHLLNNNPQLYYIWLTTRMSGTVHVCHFHASLGAALMKMEMSDHITVQSHYNWPTSSTRISLLCITGKVRAWKYLKTNMCSEYQHLEHRQSAKQSFFLC